MKKAKEISELDYTKLLSEKLKSYIYVKETHYHFYQFYANMSVSLIIFVLTSALHFKKFDWVLFVIFAALEITLICGSKNCLNTLYKKIEALSK